MVFQKCSVSDVPKRTESELYMDDLNHNVEKVIKFWFEELTQKDWWIKSKELDAKIRSRFGDLHQIAKEGKLESIRFTPEARLAELIILDQFSRNIYRDNPNSFACDELAISFTS
ncbi:MAG: DUF924 family protein [Bdellovibrionota bacterium]